MAIGYPHPDFLLSEIDSRQYSEWLAFYEVEPFGDERADIRSAIAAMDIVNASGAKPRVTLERYLPFRPKDTPKTADDLYHKLLAMFPDNGHDSRDQNLSEVP